MSTLGFGRQKLIEDIIKTNWGISNVNKKNFNYNEILFIVQELLEEEGKKYFERRSPRRGYHIFREFVKYLLYRNLANYDSMLLITSEKGTGKSSAGIMLCREWCKQIGIRFRPDRHIAYNNADVMRKIDMLNKFEPILCLPGNSKITIKRNNKYKREAIKNLVGKTDYQILSYNIKNDDFEWKELDGVVFNGYKTIDTIELENGIKIQATPEHKLLTKNRGFVEVKNLTENDELVLETKKCKNCSKEFYSEHIQKKFCSDECRKENVKVWNREHRKKSSVKNWYKNRYISKMKNDICFRLSHNLHTRIMPFVKIKTKQDEDRTTLAIGCNINFFKQHLEQQFIEGMAWQNYGVGKGKWSIDHKIPFHEIDIKNEVELKKNLHYTNIRPLWNNLNSSRETERVCIVCNKKFVSTSSIAKLCSPQCRYKNGKRKREIDEKKNPQKYIDRKIRYKENEKKRIKQQRLNT